MPNYVISAQSYEFFRYYVGCVKCFVIFGNSLSGLVTKSAFVCLNGV